MDAGQSFLMNPCCILHSFSVPFSYTFSNSNYSFQQIKTITGLIFLVVDVPVYPHRCAIITVILLGIIEGLNSDTYYIGYHLVSAFAVLKCFLFLRAHFHFGNIFAKVVLGC